jgi:hypothetical protein
MLPTFLIALYLASYARDERRNAGMSREVPVSVECLDKF